MMRRLAGAVGVPESMRMALLKDEAAALRRHVAELEQGAVGTGG